MSFHFSFFIRSMLEQHNKITKETTCDSLVFDQRSLVAVSVCNLEGYSRSNATDPDRPPQVSSPPSIPAPRLLAMDLPSG